MKIDVFASNNVTVIKPDGDIRVKTLIPLRKVFEQLQDERRVNIAIDLTKVHFIDSSGIGILLNFAKRQKDVKGLVCLYNYRDDVKELLDIIDLGDFIPVYKNYEEMERALAG